MALTRTLTNYNKDGVNTNISQAFTVTSGTQLLIIRLHGRGVASSPTVGTATYGGSNLTRIAFEQDASNQGVFSAVYQVVNPSNGTFSVPITQTSNARISFEQWVSSTGTATLEGDTATSNKTTGTSVTLSLPSTLVTGEYAVFFTSSNNIRTWSAYTNWTADYLGSDAANQVGTTNSVKVSSFYSTTNGVTQFSGTISSSANQENISYIVQEIVSFIPTISWFE